MADAAVAANGGGEGEQQQQQSWFEMLKGMIWRFMIMYFIMNLFKGGGDKSAAPNSSSNGQVATTNSLKAKNLFDRGTVMDMYLYISEDERIRWKRDDKLAVDSPPTAFLAWKLEDVEYGDWTGGASADGVFHLSTTVPISERVQN